MFHVLHVRVRAPHRDAPSCDCSGATNTEVVIVDAAGAVVARAHGGPSNGWVRERGCCRATVLVGFRASLARVAQRNLSQRRLVWSWHHGVCVGGLTYASPHRPHCLRA
jgi:hypothetical protein